MGPPERIGRLKVKRMPGCGSMSVTYLAKDSVVDCKASEPCVQDVPCAYQRSGDVGAVQGLLGPFSELLRVSRDRA